MPSRRDGYLRLGGTTGSGAEGVSSEHSDSVSVRPPIPLDIDVGSTGGEVTAGRIGVGMETGGEVGDGVEIVRDGESVT